MLPSESLRHAKAVFRQIIASRQDRPSLVFDVACDIGADIVEGTYSPGDDLNSVDLSQRYSTSRTPIREALMLLDKEGLVDIPPRRRPRVKVHDLDEVREIYRTRALLIEFLASDVVRYASEAEFQQLDEALDKMKAAAELNDLSAFLWANVEFHDLNTRIARNRTIKRIIDSLLLRTLRLRRLSLSQGSRLTESYEDHKRILAAYRRHDALSASALLRANHVNALARLEVVLG